MHPRTDPFNMTLAHQQEESQSLNLRRYPKPRTPRDPSSYNFGATSLAFNAHFENQAESYPQERNDIDPMGRYADPDLEPCERVFGYLTQDDQPKMRVLVLTDSTIPPRFTPSMLIKDVQWVGLPRSSYPQMSGYVDTVKKAKKGKDTTGKRYPDMVVMMKVFNHQTTEGTSKRSSSQKQLTGP